MNRTKLDIFFNNNPEVDALISEAPQTRLWYAGVQTTDGFIIIERNKATLFVDGRYIEYVRANAKNVDVQLLQRTKEGSSIKKFFEEKKFKKIALEKDYLIKDVENYILSLTNLTSKDVVWVSAQELRILKSKEELKYLQEAVNISLKSLEQLKEWIKPGMNEKEVAAKLNYLLKMNGAEKEGFDEIVAAAQYASEPHHHPSENNLLIENHLLKVDFAARYKGYTADITRTFVVGDPKKTNPELLKILKIVEESAAEGRKIVRPGIKASEIDRVCREYIESKGYGKYFVHSTGHGLGIDVHEFPNVSSSSDVILEPGMVLTVEPGIYIEGLGGARNEDDVLVTEDGYYVLSKPEEKKNNFF
ncbi:aminopeptidase P family protein [Mycoplasma sp. CSL10137]|uniref:M24 family metallopeptidase n=1 Tax=unclassified Mycoplasma TaxID=2683645 RepID=UPI00197C3584|nr:MULTISPECIES: M24 family metallopeptidase [unclassified Mycoplasma]MBN4083458.1 aminopeptidase P family protein [Mycoplasma sp. CSL10137]MBN4084611.1 aminopeptidase P family protein [Mycoplasma sp. CSL10166]MBU4693089.1 aminopeptidase P family protein [Mycoplasma sp. CSL7491-lung]